MFAVAIYCSDSNVILIENNLYQSLILLFRERIDKIFCAVFKVKGSMISIFIQINGSMHIYLCFPFHHSYFPSIFSNRNLINVHI